MHCQLFSKIQMVVWVIVPKLPGLSLLQCISGGASLRRICRMMLCLIKARLHQPYHSGGGRDQGLPSCFSYGVGAEL